MYDYYKQTIFLAEIMEEALVENIQSQLEVSQNGSTLDLSLIGKGKEFKKLKTYIATLFILLLTISQTTIAILVLVGVIDFSISITPIKSAHFLPFHFLLVLQSFCWLSTILLDRFLFNHFGKFSIFITLFHYS